MQSVAAAAADDQGGRRLKRLRRNEKAGADAAAQQVGCPTQTSEFELSRAFENELGLALPCMQISADNAECCMHGTWLSGLLYVCLNGAAMTS